ncbi:MAG: threonine synthase [Phycisphaerales bacterium]|nr:threonine synthase [Phycisphaerales bacterium]
MSAGASAAHLRCINPDCGSTAPASSVLYECPRCRAMLDVAYDDAAVRAAAVGGWKTFEGRHASAVGVAADREGLATARRLDYSGVWRFREFLPFYGSAENVVTLGEGRTLLQRADAIARDVGLNPGAPGGGLYLQYEGFNPSGSFKDNGMTAGFTHARLAGARRVVCASTGNTSASLAMYASAAGVVPIVLIGSGKIAYGKLSQALDYGARTLQIEGDFDACLKRVRQIGVERPELGVYVMNSVNPFRLEGQKAIMYRILEGLGWRVPDWIVVPGGNLGNCSAFGKAFWELRRWGLIDRVPRLAVINAKGADTLERLVNGLGVRWREGRWDAAAATAELARLDARGWRAHTVASAIEIGRPVNLPKALRALDYMNGVVRSVTDEEILDDKALIGRRGYGCEPACAAAVAGVRNLVREGVIPPDSAVACVITGHVLKDPDATVKYHAGVDVKAVSDRAPTHEPHGRWSNRPVRVKDDLDAIVRAMA